MKSQIGSGWSHTTLKYFERLKLSMKVSIINERIARPSKEYKPVSMPNIKKPAAVINASDTSRARPMSKLEYFFRIIAMISVPPLDAPILKRIAEPRAGRTIAKQSSSIGWSVKGSDIGYSLSMTDNAIERRMLQYAVFAANFLPKMIIPIKSRIILVIRLKSPAEIRPVFATSTARPVIPPNVKLFVNLKKYVPAAINIVLKVRRKKCLALFIFVIPFWSKDIIQQIKHLFEL